MGIRSVLLLMVCISAFPAPQANAQFVTLEGRQFMLDGEEFYPRVMNYGVSFATEINGTTTASEIYLSPDGPYDYLNDDAFECNNQADCEAQLLLHFQKIASMGFNTVRIVRAVPHMYKSSSGSNAIYKLPIRPNTGQWHANYMVDMDLEAPAALVERYFSLLNGLLSKADEAGLKVILLSGIELFPYPSESNLGILQFLTGDANLYALMLHRLAEGLKDQTALMAYDMLNEPAWRNGTNIRWIPKSDVCNYTAMWYDAIKAGSEGRHLVTLGGIATADLGNWDPAVMKLDFYSPHPYIDPSWMDDYNMVNAIERYKAEVYWTAQKSTMPWMIGETGFSADDDEDFEIGTDQSWVLLRPEQEYHEMPYMHGSEQEQVDFALMSMDLTRAYMGSGYSWWTFQNSKSAPIEQNVLTPLECIGNYWGALGYGDGTNRWREKMVVEEFTDYDLPPAPTILPAPPPAYTNWHAFNTPVYRTYYPKDLYNQPVMDALMSVTWRYQSPGDPSDFVFFYYHAVTGPDGSMVLRRPPPYSGYNSPTLWSMYINASAMGGWSPSSPWPDGATLPLWRNLLEYATTLTGVELAWHPGKDYKAWAKLTVQDVNIHESGTTNPVRFIARQFVHLNAEFHAGVGSEVHLFTNETFPDCNSPWYIMAPPQPELPPETKTAEQPEPSTGRLDLRFMPAAPGLIAFPNPFIDRFTIEGSPQGPFTVFGAQGAIVHRGAKQADQLIINADHWPPGVYRIHMEAPNGPHTLSITKVR